MRAHLLKVGHFTLDNASNNGTMMQALETKLRQRDIDFDADDRRIMCFAHVIDLCSGRVVRAACDGPDEVEDDLDEDDSSSSDEYTVPPNPIAQARAVVRAIRGSGARRDDFQNIISQGNENEWFKEGKPPKTVKIKALQLVRDVPTRWDSVYRMLNRLREMRPVCLYSLNFTECNARSLIDLLGC